jgi:hypothetical protein
MVAFFYLYLLSVANEKKMKYLFTIQLMVRINNPIRL